MMVEELGMLGPLYNHAHIGVFVTPAKEGIQLLSNARYKLDSRLRGNDNQFCNRAIASPSRTASA